jgi:hypothetical protein
VQSAYVSKWGETAVTTEKILKVFIGVELMRAVDVELAE